MLWKMQLPRLNRCDFNGGAGRGSSLPGTFNRTKSSFKRVVFIPKLGGFKFQICFFIFTPPDSVWEDDPIFDENCAYFSKWVG